jgi:hypothetical protein
MAVDAEVLIKIGIELTKAALQELNRLWMAIDSGHFKDLISGQVISEVSYTADEYLTLLNTYSPYIKLDPENKESLFLGLRHRIEDDFGGSLQLSYISAFHIAQKVNSERRES